ncbi:RteC protein [Arachidicoccus rhizosphaerae]|uniref:RteC protein n=1 Tax=Arachidicoccus rhizosphaerae TaxID=551991 RepID=A0A1H3YTB0_9BACT|nr:RteC domain-containing protein [Arachidicoccus rhizosphaerae]SEA14799.1 RteC protein [Arachidicoccus rhizosphaerae]
MDTTAKLIFMEMAEQINNIRPNNILERAELSYKIVKESVRKLNDSMEQYTFKNQEEEIRYFKYIRPQLLREQIYYAELYYLESLKPSKDKQSIEQYLNDHLKYNNQYFERNRTFYNYYRRGQTHQDQVLFVSMTESALLPTEGAIEKDSYLSQGHSYILARLQALEILNSYIQNEINTLNNRSPSYKEPGELTWTASKVALIELLYALASIGAFNHGKADLKTIINTFQEMFSIHLGNYYAVIQQNIRIRKKNRTAFLDSLKEYMERRMDETDENPRFT